MITLRINSVVMFVGKLQLISQASWAQYMLIKHDSVGMEEAVKRKMFNLFKEKESFVQSCLEVWNFCTHTQS